MNNNEQQTKESLDEETKINNNVEEGTTSQEPEEVSEIVALRNKLEVEQEERKKYYDLYFRSLAELDNFKKRSARDKEEYTKYAPVPLIKKLLPVVDDLDRALDQFSSSEDLKALSKGVEMVTKKLKEALQSEGVVAVEALGKPFDPQFHQPLMVEESDEHPENTVIDELQRGYTFHGRVIRPSLVKVSK